MDEIALEHRLTRIEEATVRIEATMTRLDEKVGRQNGRIGKMEEWRTKTDHAAAFARGVADGRNGITKTQMAILAFVGPVMFAVADLALKYLV